MLKIPASQRSLKMCCREKARWVDRSCGGQSRGRRQIGALDAGGAFVARYRGAPPLPSRPALARSPAGRLSPPLHTTLHPKLHPGGILRLGGAQRHQLKELFLYGADKAIHVRIDVNRDIGGA